MTWPTDLMVDLVVQTIVIFKSLTGDRYGNQFRTTGNQRSILAQLALQRCKQTCDLSYQCSTCNTTMPLSVYGVGPSLANLYRETPAGETSIVHIVRDRSSDSDNHTIISRAAVWKHRSPIDAGQTWRPRAKSATCRSAHRTHIGWLNVRPVKYRSYIISTMFDVSERYGIYFGAQNTSAERSEGRAWLIC